MKAEVKLCKALLLVCLMVEANGPRAVKRVAAREADKLARRLARLHKRRT